MLLAVIIENYNKLNQFIKDKWNYPFIFSGSIILFTSFIHVKNYASHKLINPDQINIWAGIFNWLPFFFLFWGFQPFLKTKLSREISSKIIISGTIPVILSGFVQYCPPKVGGKNWTKEDKDAFGKTVIQQIADYSPGFKDRILHMEVRTP